MPTLAIHQLEHRSWTKSLNYCLKFLLGLSFVIALGFNLPTLEGKGMLLRAPFFLTPIWLFPLLSKLKKWPSYPHLGDALFAVPFLLDTLGNIFGLFDSIAVFDDIIHAVNWFFLILAFHFFRFRKVNDRRDAIQLGIGLSAILSICWEAIEWLVSVDGLGTVSALHLTYNDTIADLILSFSGGIAGSILGVFLFGKKLK